MHGCLSPFSGDGRSKPSTRDDAGYEDDGEASDVPSLDFVSSRGPSDGESDAAYSSTKSGKKTSKEMTEDRLKRKFILDGVCCDFLSHGYFRANPRIQCVRKPYNAIKDPMTGKYFENEHVVALCNKTGQLDYKDPNYRGVAIEGPIEERAYNIGEFHWTLRERNRHGCGRAYETYKGIDLYYDLPKQLSRRTFEQEVFRWKQLVIPGYMRYGPPNLEAVPEEEPADNTNAPKVHTSQFSLSLIICSLKMAQTQKR